MNHRIGNLFLACAATSILLGGCFVVDKDSQPKNSQPENSQLQNSQPEDLKPGDLSLEETQISEVRDRARADEMLGKPVRISGVIVADYRKPGQLGGVFLQQPQGVDSDRSSSMFIRVDATEPIAIGDQIHVRGLLTEVGDRPRVTPFADQTALEIQNDGPVGLIEPIDLSPLTQEIDWKSLDGMLVRIPADMVVTDTYDLARYGQVTLAVDERLYIPTEYIDPNDREPSGNTTAGELNVAKIRAAEARDNQRSIVLDDGSAEQNRKDIFLLPTTLQEQAPITLRLGTRIKNLTAVVTKAKGRFMLMPAGEIEIEYDPRPPVPDLGQCDLTIASFNVLNYFTTIDDGRNQARGADSVEEFARQRDKIIAALVQLDADIIGLMELENNLKSEQDLVASLNNAVDGDPFVGVGIPAEFKTAPGATDAIRVGIIYRRDRVEPTGGVEMVVDPAFVNARTPLVQEFRRTGDETKFSVIVNHFKSKGSGDGAEGTDRDLKDGQASYNGSRRNQAAALTRYAESIRKNESAEHLLILGDLNAYSQEDPIDTLRGAGLTDLLQTFAGEKRPYTYVYSGRAGCLDHAFATPELAAMVTRAAAWNINSSEPPFLDYNLEFNPKPLYLPDPFRSSDHDPVLVGIDLP